MFQNYNPRFIAPTKEIILHHLAIPAFFVMHFKHPSYSFYTNNAEHAGIELAAGPRSSGAEVNARHHFSHNPPTQMWYIVD